jgi:hypothetical protein
VNDIRLVASFEIESSTRVRRVLSRTECEALADTLAQDLIRQAEGAGSGLLVVGGGLFEPAELLRPGFPAWQALSDLSRNAFLSPGGEGSVMAIGAHQGRLPDARLSPVDGALSGQLLALPMVLRCADDDSDRLSEQFESTLFEKGGLHPPTRAAFAQATGLDTGHGQLMTLNDLIALTHVQMDTAGLGAFWPVVEQVLVQSEASAQFDLPGPLEARWCPRSGAVRVRFRTFDDFAGTIDDYALWTRAYRSLSALLSLHGIDRQVESDHTLDADRHALLESTGTTEAGAGLTEQVHSDCGLLCWTLIEDRKQFNLYPLDAAGLSLLRKDFAARGLDARRPSRGVEIDPDSNTLRSAH